MWTVDVVLDTIGGDALARMGEAHDLLENRRSYALHGKVAIDVAGDTVALPPRAA